MRQVLVDPESVTNSAPSSTTGTSSSAGSSKNKKHNWDKVQTFPDVPKQLNVIGTRVLKTTPNFSPTTSSGGSGNPNEAAHQEQQQQQIMNHQKSSALLDIWNHDGYNQYVNDVDVITYFLLPNDIEQTQLVIHHINYWKSKSKSTTIVSTTAAISTTNVSTNPIANIVNPITKKNTTQETKFHKVVHHRLVYLPHVTTLLQKVHENMGLTNNPSIAVHQLQLDLFPLESDVISLEYDNVLYDDVIQHTPSQFITMCSRSLLKLQEIVNGPISRIQSYGTMAEKITKKLFTNTVDEYLVTTSANTNTNPAVNSPSIVEVNHTTRNNTTTMGTPSSVPVDGGEITTLIILDRKVDWVTPLVTTLTYEGLLDDVVGIDCGYIDVNVQIINPDDNDVSTTPTLPDSRTTGAATGTGSSSSNTSSPHCRGHHRTGTKNNTSFVTLGVNGSDALYTEVRNQHVETFGTYLQNQARTLQQSHANFTDKNKKKELAEIHQFVKQMPMIRQNLRSLTNHIHLAELVKKTSESTTFRELWQLERSILEGEICYDQIDDLIAVQYHPYRLLRLLCLQSLCSGGIKATRYDTMKRDIVQTYGYEYLFVLSNLEKADLLRRREGLWLDATVASLTSGGGGSVPTGGTGQQQTQQQLQQYNTLRKLLILIHSEVDTNEPDDIAYVSSGYAPISVRLIQSAMKGWYNGREDIIKELLGPAAIVTTRTSSVSSSTTTTSSSPKFYDLLQKYPPEDFATALVRSNCNNSIQMMMKNNRYNNQQQQKNSKNIVGSNAGGTGSAENSLALSNLAEYATAARAVAAAEMDQQGRTSNTTGTSSSTKKPVLVVFYVGGITYMEIAALRFLSKRPGFPYHIIILTTKITNGVSVLHSLAVGTS